jgi:hypothetical protein
MARALVATYSIVACDLAALGYEGELADAFARWSGTENLEERVDGVERIDPVVLDALREER